MPRLDTDKMITELEAISEQIAASSQNDRGRVGLANRITTLAAAIDEQEWAAVPTGLVESLTTLAGELAPQATVTWNRDRTLAMFTALVKLSDAGLLSDDETARLAKVTIPRTRAVGGSREPAPDVEGRPWSTVTVTDVVNHKDVTKRGINARKPQAVASTLAAILRYVEQHAPGIEIDKREARDAIASVIEGGANTYTLMGALTITGHA